MMPVGSAHRSLLPSLLVLPLVLAVGPAGAQGQGTPPPSGGPMRVTSDTAEYCVELSQRVSHAEQARPDATAPVRHRAEVDELAAEGQQMCATGLIRGGLLRLRRAWMLLRSDK